MSNISNIKTKLDSLSNRKQLFSSMELNDSEKLKKTEKQIHNYKSFMEDFFGILGYVNNTSFFDSAKVGSSSKKLILVFSADKGFCGNYNNKLFKNISREYSNDKSDVDVFCVGKRSFEFFAKNGFNVVGYLKLSDEFGLEDLSEIYDYLLSSVSNNAYGDISVYLNLFRNKTSSKTVNYNLYPLSEDSFNVFMDDLGISMPKNSGEIPLGVGLQEFQLDMKKQLLQYMLYGVALQNKVAELKSRISVAENMRNTSEFVVKDLKLSFNRLCQSLLTREVSNIMELKPTY